ncbi:hypothetical protein [Pseudoalteromonas luteoviolacea]|uniref:hypothetical protein n=1 Tax=Pseudoalteromonas luteoviolacea TaxID=43657 RepID=UPI0007B0B861|nr:hypothetical protein [Pseudoalteromonas luteoviolacea]KZN58415.1 hypothetical protein N474_25535 [Pseudoalteromonas luteoviolacea CPMOR-2]TQF71127.1 hypothetical protein FLM44_08570 [Pseudoalteromonas luteoviolacea]
MKSIKGTLIQATQKVKDSRLAKFGIATGAMVASGSALASTPDVGATLAAAITAGQTNYTTVVVGLLALAAIGFGVGFIVSKLSR